MFQSSGKPFIHDFMDLFKEKKITFNLLYLYFYVLVPYVDLRSAIRAHNSKYVIENMGMPH